MDLTTAILDSVSVGVIVLDRNEVVHVWNEFMAVHSGVTARDAIGKNVFDVVPDLPRAWMRHKLQSVFLLGNFSFSNWTERPFLLPLSPVRIVTTELEAMYQDCMFIPIRNAEEQIEAVCLTIIDASDAALSHRRLEATNRVLEQERNALKQAKDEISHLAYHDPLTELPNRRFLNRYLTRLLHAALPNQRPFALLSIDLDGFKKINDTMGHPVGDEVLAIIARRLVQAARATDFAVRRTDAPAEIAEHTIGRVGGDEFMVVLPAIRQPDDAATVARRIIEQCSQPLSVRGKTVYLGASIGIAIFPNDGQDVVSLVKNADIALYDSKCRGKGNHQFYSARMNEQTAERLWLETALRAAHENCELVPYFQPQIDIVNQRVVGVEALMRWKHPERGLIGPDKFIPLAEESGFITVIGRAMRREVCRQASAWLEGGLGDLRDLGERVADRARAGVIRRWSARDARGDVSSTAHPGSRGHRARLPSGLSGVSETSHPPEGSRSVAVSRRLRHWLLVAELPGSLPVRLHQDRSILHRRRTAREHERHRGHCDHQPGSQPRDRCGGRRRRDRGPIGVSERAGMPHRSGLPVRSADAGRRDWGVVAKLLVDRRIYAGIGRCGTN